MKAHSPLPYLFQQLRAVVGLTGPTHRMAREDAMNRARRANGGRWQASRQDSRTTVLRTAMSSILSYFSYFSYFSLPIMCLIILISIAIPSPNSNTVRTDVNSRYLTVPVGKDVGTASEKSL